MLETEKDCGPLPLYPPPIPTQCRVSLHHLIQKTGPLGASERQRFFCATCRIFYHLCFTDLNGSDWEQNSPKITGACWEVKRMVRGKLSNTFPLFQESAEVVGEIYFPFQIGDLHLSFPFRLYDLAQFSLTFPTSDLKVTFPLCGS